MGRDTYQGQERKALKEPGPATTIQLPLQKVTSDISLPMRPTPTVWCSPELSRPHTDVQEAAGLSGTEGTEVKGRGYMGSLRVSFVVVFLVAGIEPMGGQSLSHILSHF